MALSVSLISSAISAAAPDMAGLLGPSTALGVATGLYTWCLLPANFAFSGVTTGDLGAGVVTGQLSVSANLAAVAGGLSAFGVVGPTANVLARAVAFGVASSFTASGQYTGPSLGVALGIDSSVASVVNQVTLASSLSSALSSFYDGAGLALPVVSQGLASGLSVMLQTTVGIGVVTGTPTGAVPSVGTSPLSTVF